MQCSSALILRQHEPVSGSLRALPLEQSCSQADAEALRFHLNCAIHEHDLEGPPLQPTQSEGIGHQLPLSASASPYGASGILQGSLCQQMHSDRFSQWFAGTPDPCHEMGFCGDRFKTCGSETGFDVVTDVVPVVGLVKHPAEVFHRHAELG